MLKNKMMKKLFLSFVALVATTTLWAQTVVNGVKYIDANGNE